MKEFNDFIQYAKEHINEIQYDPVSSLQNEWNQGLTLSKEDVFLITKISNQQTMALLRHYHQWLQSQK